MGFPNRLIAFTCDAQNIVAQIGSSSVNIPWVIDPEFGFSMKFVRLEGVVVPSLIVVLVVNLGAQNHSAASSRKGSLNGDEDPIDALYMPP